VLGDHSADDAGQQHAADGPAQQRAADHTAAVGCGQACGHRADYRRDDRGGTDERCRTDQR
jgi:hypothetical protein